MKWYIQLESKLFTSPDNPSESEYEAEQKIKYLGRIHKRKWDAFRVFQASDDADAKRNAEAWWKTQKK